MRILTLLAVALIGALSLMATTNTSVAGPLLPTGLSDVSKATTSLETVHHTRRYHRNRRRRVYDDEDYQPPVYDDGTFGLYLGERRNGRYGCRRGYSGFHPDRPCWARRALAPPRFR